MGQVTGFATAASHVLLDTFTDGLHFSLLAIGSPKFEAAHLKRHEAVGKLDHMDETVQVVRGQDKTVPLADHSPAAEHYVTAEAGLQRSGQVLVKDGVEVVVVSSGITLKMSGQPRVAVIYPFGIIVSFPELDRSHVGCYEDGRPQDWI